MAKPNWYVDHVGELEHNLPAYAFKTSRGRTLENEDIFKRYSDRAQNSEGQAQLMGRTPTSVDRDRILFSKEFRRLDDKYHLLFFGNARLSRNYTSHSLRAAHVGRSVANRVHLNADLVDAIVLGSKVGAVSFIHRAKGVIHTWMVEKVNELDDQATDKKQSQSPPALLNYDPLTDSLVIPSWIDNLQSPALKAQVEAAIPWASGYLSSSPYQSGSESYWTLTTNPFLRTSTDSTYLAQTMYGIWRHSRNPAELRSGQFQHEMRIGAEHRLLTAEHFSHEAVLGRYCDDITWVLENLSEASRVASLSGDPQPFVSLANQNKQLPAAVKLALQESDPGALYSYFIDDLIQTSQPRLEAAGEKASESEPAVSLSKVADESLSTMVEFLQNQVFNNRRIDTRNATLEQIVRTVLDVFYSTWDRTLPPYLSSLAKLDGWFTEQAVDSSLGLLEAGPNRIQACVDVLTSMSDREIYEVLGLE